MVGFLKGIRKMAEIFSKGSGPSWQEVTPGKLAENGNGSGSDYKLWQTYFSVILNAVKDL
jgi:hypothetical protein